MLLVPMILVLMAVGVYVINGRVIDLWIMFAAGVAGYFLEKLDVPLAPIVLGLILGPMAEQSVRRALLISRGEVTELVTRPLSSGLSYGQRRNNEGPKPDYKESRTEPVAGSRVRKPFASGQP